MIDYQVISKPDCEVTNFEYCKVWAEPYVCIDARFINLNASRGVCLHQLKGTVYKLIAIHDNIHEGLSADDISKHIGGKIAYAVKANRRSPIYQTDVVDTVDWCLSNECPSDISIFSDRRVEWVGNLSNLVAFTSEEQMEYESIKDEGDRLAFKLDLIAKKKRSYASKCLSAVRTAGIMEDIYISIEAALSTPEMDRITYQTISDDTGYSYNTIKKYVDLLRDRLSYTDFSKRDKEKEELEQKIQDACYAIHDRGEYINKMKIHRESMVSRPTIDKKWHSEDFKLGNLVETLNHKLQK